MTDASSQHRRFGRLVLGIAAVLAALFIGFGLWTQQYWMFAFLVLIIPNLYIGIRELRAARRQ
jgi:uncharacterized membrane protein YhaH (DUF805 family)